MRLLTLSEAASVARVSTHTLRRVLRDPCGPTYLRVGSGRGTIRIDEAALADWLATRTVSRATDRDCAA